MGPEIEAANQHVIKIFNDLKEKYNEQKNFQFGVVFYRDQIYAKSDNVKKYYGGRTMDWNNNIKRNESGFFQLTNNMENLIFNYLSLYYWNYYEIYYFFWFRVNRA